MKARTETADKPVLPESKRQKTDGVRPLAEDGTPLDAPFTGGVRLEDSITIGRSAHELYAYWRDFTNLPRFCKYLRRVEIVDGGRSRWTAEGPGGRDLSWEATMIEDRPDELISWRSYETSDFVNAGSVRFVPAPGDRGTEVHVTFAYNPPAGPVGALIAKLSLKDPGVLLHEQLRRLKQLMETGEIATTDGQSAVVEE